LAVSVIFWTTAASGGEARWQRKKVGGAIGVATARTVE